MSGSTKVVNLGTNRKRIFDFLLVVNSNLCASCTIMEIRRLKGRKSPICTYPTLIQHPCSGWPPSNFGMNLISAVNEATIWWRNHDRRSNHVDTVHECDRQTDRQTDGRTELLLQRPCNAERRTVKTNRQTRPPSSVGSRPPLPKFSGYVEVEAHYIFHTSTIWVWPLFTEVGPNRPPP